MDKHKETKIYLPNLKQKIYLETYFVLFVVGIFLIFIFLSLIEVIKPIMDKTQEQNNINCYTLERGYVFTDRVYKISDDIYNNYTPTQKQFYNKMQEVCLNGD